MHNEQGPEGARLEPERFSGLLGLLELLGDLFDRSEIDLRYDLGFTPDPLDLADIIVGCPNNLTTYTPELSNVLEFWRISITGID